MNSSLPCPPRPGRPFRRGLLLSSLACLALASPASGAPPPGLGEQPLAPRSGPRGATLFAEQPAARTGVVAGNPYADPEMWGQRYQELAYGEIGTGLAVGDFDGDGRPDLFVVAKTGPCHLYRNLGDWRFEEVTAQAGLREDAGMLEKGLAWVKGLAGKSGASDPLAAWNQGAVFADVNNDGRPDLYVTRMGAPNRLFVNQGDGTFKEEASARGLALVDGSGAPAFCDYDRDGWLDVYVQTNLLDATAHPNGQPDHLFHNNGNGTFTEVTRRAGIAGDTCGHSATWWDYDGDGWPDLYVANDYAPADRLYHNNRNGTFTDVLDATIPHTPYYGMGADFGDVDNDGRFDLLVADMAPTSHEKDQRGMAGSRARAQLHPPNPGPAAQVMRNALYLNTGAGRFLEAACLAGVSASDWTWSVRFEDLDNDGRVDLHLTNGMVREYHNTDLLQRVLESEGLGDSRRILRASPVLAETHLAFRNLGGLKFESVGHAWGLDQKGVSFGAVFADFDGDGDLDLAFANFEGPPTLLRNDSDSGHRVILALQGTRSNRFGAGTVVELESAAGTQVRQLVLTRGYLSGSEPIVHFGLGSDERIRKLTLRWPGGAVQTFTDLPVDRRFIITEPTDTAPGAPDAPAAPAWFREIGGALPVVQAVPSEKPGDVGQQPLLPWTLNQAGPALAAGDLDGDGRDDLVVGGTPQMPAKVFLARPDGTFGPGSALTPVRSGAADDGPCLILDTDGDGRADVLVTHAGTRLPAGATGYQPVLLLNQGAGRFEAAPAGVLPEAHASVGAAAAADFDRDGRLDVFLGARVEPGAYPVTPRSFLWRNRGGSFEDVTETLAPGLAQAGLVTAALWTDVDGDGWTDLLVACEWGPIRCWRNQAGRGFVEDTAAGFGDAGNGIWTSLGAADFNRDGRPDYVVGNLGLNTPYQATPEAPALLYYGAFAGGASRQLVEAWTENGRVVPRRTRNELAAVIPAVARKYPKNDDYARAGLPEILGAERLAAARRFSASELRSGVFLSQPDGRYRFSPLPRLAQVAPAQGLQTGDFDGDGRADVYLVQNLYSTATATGRFDGGLSQLLRGDGAGGFTPVGVAESGLVVPGDAKALVLLDPLGRGWADFFVSRNNQDSLWFRNSGQAGRHALSVRLKGRPGNLAAAGAQVMLELARGAAQVAEVYSGGGYRSQSVPVCFFGYADGDAPVRVRVRWPDGKESSQPVPAGATSMVMAAP